MNPTFVARLDEELHVSIHEWDRHRNCRAIREYKVRILPELLDHAEYVVPTAAIEARAVIPKLVYDL